jgi:hypothetical protein
VGNSAFVPFKNFNFIDGGGAHLGTLNDCILSAKQILASGGFGSHPLYYGGAA